MRNGGATKTMRVDVWSDIACPWCYVGKRRLEAALARFPHGNDVEVVWRAFELDPSAPRALAGDVSHAERIARKYGTSVAQAEAMTQRMTDVAAGEGLDFHFEKIRPGNTFDAHRLLHLARERGMADAVKERLLRAYMTEGESMSDPDVLVRLAGEAGLDEEEARSVIASGSYAREVREDEAEAHRLGISGVPFFAIAGRYGVSGAQPADVLLASLTKAWGATRPLEVDAADGAVCGPNGCV
jgi:predicted DsbA family dithiol-disulfide isomerase